MAAVNTAKPQDAVSLLGRGKYSDFILVCGEYEFKVHRYVLSKGSQFFNRLCDDEGFAEGRDGRATLPEDSPGLICRLLQYIYLGDFPVGLISCDTSGQPVAQFQGVVDEYEDVLHQFSKRTLLYLEMYKLGEKYDVPGLTNCAYELFLRSLYAQDLENKKEVVDKDDTRVTDNDELSPKEMMDRVIKIWSPIIEAVYGLEIHSTIKFRIPVLAVMHICIDNCAALKHESFRKMIADNPSFGVDLATLRLTKSKVKCSSCNDSGVYIIGVCACGSVGGCEEATCQQQWKEETYCTSCWQKNTLEYPENE